MTISHRQLHLPGLHRSFAERLRESRTLVPTAAVLAVTVVALLTALVVNRSQAQSIPEGTSTAFATSAPAPRMSILNARLDEVLVAGMAGNICTVCGMVESVTPVQKQVYGNGGAGNITLVAAGAAHKTKAYVIRVRMDDGSLRTFEHTRPVEAGAQVRVDGNVLRLAPAPGTVS